jgi:hypothetical protein
MTTTTYRTRLPSASLRACDKAWLGGHSCRRTGPVFVPLLHVLRICAICLAICCSGVTRIANAQEPLTAAVDAAIVRPFVSETTVFILKVDPKRIGLPELANAVESMPPDAERAYRQVFEQAGAGIEQLRALVNDQPLYATVGIPISPTRMPTFVFVEKLPSLKAAKLTDFLRGRLKLDSCLHGDYVVTTLRHGMEVAKLLAVSPALSREGLEDAFESVANYPVQVLLLPPSYVWRTVRELSPELPRQLGGGPSSVLTEGLQWVALGVDPAELRAQLAIQSSSNSAARDLAAHLPKMLQSACEAAPEVHKQMPVELSQALLRWLDPQIDGQRITMRINGFENVDVKVRLLGIFVARTIEEKARRHTNRERFKQIVLGMLNYCGANRTFPPADKYRGKDGGHYLSWRVHILPFVDQMKLYDQFHLNEPWDSPHNKKLIAKMPDIYRSDWFGIPLAVAFKPGYTSFLAPVGEDTIFGGAEATTISKIDDGTSNTAVLVEAEPEKAVPWTAPDDCVFDPKDPAAGILIGDDGRWLCAMANGSVHQLRGDIPPKTLLHLFQMSDGQPVDYSTFR